MNGPPSIPRTQQGGNGGAIAERGIPQPLTAWHVYRLASGHWEPVPPPPVHDDAQHAPQFFFLDGADAPLLVLSTNGEDADARDGYEFDGTVWRELSEAQRHAYSPVPDLGIQLLVRGGHHANAGYRCVESMEQAGSSPPRCRPTDRVTPPPSDARDEESVSIFQTEAPDAAVLDLRGRSFVFRVQCPALGENYSCPYVAWIREAARWRRAGAVGAISFDGNGMGESYHAAIQVDASAQGPLVFTEESAGATAPRRLRVRLFDGQRWNIVGNALHPPPDDDPVTRTTLAIGGDPILPVWCERNGAAPGVHASELQAGRWTALPGWDVPCDEVAGVVVHAHGIDVLRVSGALTRFANGSWQPALPAPLL